MRRRKIKGALERYYEFESLAVVPDDLANEKLKTFIGNQPLHIEIGTGRGQFIVETARRLPECCFVGIEMKEELLLRAAGLATENQVANVRFMLADVFKTAHCLEGLTADVIYLNFSDPWPKDRHAKRRLTHPTFLEFYRGLLKPSGKLVIKTDNRALFEFTVASLEASGYDIIERTEDLHGLCDPENVMSEYEAHFVGLEYSIFRIIAKAPR